MKGFRITLFLFLICGIMGVAFILTQEKVQPPFSRSLSPLFQELGKPIKSVDRAISRLLPLDEIDEKILGEEIKLRFQELASPKTIKEEATVAYLNTLIQKLSGHTKSSFAYQVFLVDGPPNAFAMPGGVICVTKKLLDLLENEAEIVAILGHEMGHVEMGHLFDAARGEMLRRKVKAISIFSYASDVIHSTFHLSFSKAQEDEADEYGFRMLIINGYDPIAMSTAFEKIIQQSTKRSGNTHLVEDFISSHPYTEIRIEKFRSKAQEWNNTHSEKNLAFPFTERST